MTVELEALVELFLKSSAWLMLAIALLVLVGRLEPRWRILLARAAMLALPLLLLASLLAPVVALSWLPSPPPPARAPHSLGAETGVDPLPVHESAALPGVVVGGESQADGLGHSKWRPGMLFWLVLAWGLGAALLALPQGARLRQIFGEARAGNSAPACLRVRWGEICSEFGIDRVPEIHTVAKHCSPYLVGGRRPLLVMPSQWLRQAAAEDLDHVLRHEAAHLRSGDLAWLPATRLLACLLWFQPLMWVLQVLHLRACEEAADAAAARRGGAESYRRALARLALELVPAGTAASAAFLRVPSVVGRLRVVARHVSLRPPSRWRGVLAAGLMMLAGGLLGNLGLAEKEAESAEARGEAALALTIDSIAFEDTSLRDALRMLQVAADGLTAARPKSSGEAFPFRLKLAPDVDGEVRITLRLDKVSVADALKYLADLAGAEYRIEGRKIIVTRGGGLVENPLLDAVAPGWESPAGKGVEAMTLMLNTQIIPRIDFADTPLDEALAWLEAFSHEASGRRDGGVSMTATKEVQVDVRITLRLSNVPLMEALRYVCSLAQARFMVGEEGVVITARAEPDDELYTHVYAVPEGAFLAVMPGAKIDAKATLEAAGIVFRKGASAVYNSTTDRLIVRNAKHELELVKAWLKLRGEELARAGSTDPSDIWFRGYLLMKEGEEAETAGRLAEALAKYQQALKLFRQVAAAHAEFHPPLVNHRQKWLLEKIETLRKTAAGVEHPGVSASDGAGNQRAELADSLLEIRKVNCDWHESEGDRDGQRRTVRVDVVSDRPGEVNASKINLMVYFYEIIGDERLEVSKAETETSFTSAPYDWRGEDGIETIEVKYFLPRESMEKDGRRYYGYVAELYYDDVLQYVSASPSKLMRIAP